MNISAITEVFLDQKRSSKHSPGISIQFSFHPLYSSPLSVLQPSSWHLSATHVAPSSTCVHIYLLFSDWERHLWSSKCFSEASMCLCVPYIQRYLQFFGKSFLFLFLFLYIYRLSRPALCRSLVRAWWSWSIAEFSSAQRFATICVQHLQERSLW